MIVGNHSRKEGLVGLRGERKGGKKTKSPAVTEKVLFILLKNQLETLMPN